MEENVERVNREGVVKRSGETNKIRVASTETVKSEKRLISLSPNSIVEA